MKNQKLILGLGLVGLVLLLALGGVWAAPLTGHPARPAMMQGGCCGHDMGRGGGLPFPAAIGSRILQRLPDISKKLGLSKDQETKVKKLALDTAKEQIKQREAIALKRVDLLGLFLEDKLNADAARTLIKEIGELQTQRKLMLLDDYIKFREILTPEQWEKLKAEIKRGPAAQGGPRRFTPPAKPQGFLPLSPEGDEGLAVELEQ